MSKASRFGVLLLIVMVISACTAGVNTAVSDGAQSAGFFLGLWHGFIAPITFFVSLFTDSVNIYEVTNNGNWYDFGFVLGAGLLFSGGVFGRRR